MDLDPTATPDSGSAVSTTSETRDTETNPKTNQKTPTVSEETHDSINEENSGRETEKENAGHEDEDLDGKLDENEDNVEFYMRHADLWARRTDIDKRRNERDKQRKQHVRYLLNLDDRLNYLEGELKRLLNAEEPPAGADSKEQPAIPEIKEMAWIEYEVEKGKKVPPIHSAIDALVEEPVLFGSPRAFALASVKGTRTATRLGKSSGSSAAGPQVHSMPERIRINAKVLIEALTKIAERGSLSVTAGEPIIMRRPYKFLSMHENRIRALLSQEKNLLEDDQTNGQVAAPSGKTGPDQSDSVSGSNADGAQTQRIGRTAEQPDKYPRTHTVECLELLVRFIEDYVKPTKERVPKQDRVAFDEIYALFEPGQLVYVGGKDGIPQKIWRVLRVTGGNRFLRPYNPQDDDESAFKTVRKDTHSAVSLDCYALAFDGFRFRQVYNRFDIPPFADSQPIKALPIIPYESAVRLKAFNEDLIRYRSQQFLNCVRPCHRLYMGRTVDKDSQGRPLKMLGDSVENLVFAESIHGNVMVDIEKAFQRNPNWMPDFKELDDLKVNPREWESPYDDNREIVQSDSAIDTRRQEDYLEEEARSGKPERWEQGKVDESDTLLLPDRVPAYFLRSRKWVFLQLGFEDQGGERVEYLREIIPNASAWNDLQLPGEHRIGGHKNVIQSLVDKHFAKDIDLDLVRDKGRGLIVLLHGAPGVGKTSTAECVAEVKGKPLLPITCGDLGLAPEVVENNLSKHFELAQSWDCILLLDEADVFLAERSLKDLNRNALVSVFLRILEYYEGILFLTTNKVGLIDEAFKSRIHMALYYPWLDESQTQNIWTTFIRRARQAQKNLEINEREIIDFAMEHMQKQVRSKYGQGPDGKAPGWNGRQIKNAFMSAIALAQYEAKADHQTRGATGEPRVVLTRGHFNTVALASEQFEEYLWKVHRHNSASKIAEKNHTRFDMFQSNVPGSSTESNAGHFASSSVSLASQPYQARPVTPAQQQMGYQMHPANHSPNLGLQYGQVMMQPQMTTAMFPVQSQLQQPLMQQPIQQHTQLQAPQQQWMPAAQQHNSQQQQMPQFSQQSSQFPQQGAQFPQQFPQQLAQQTPETQPQPPQLPQGQLQGVPMSGTTSVQNQQ